MSDDSETVKPIEKIAHSEEEHEPPSFSPATLGLHRVGTVLPPKPQTAQPIQLLNARGMPARIRKRNKLFFDDELINDNKSLRASLSPRKSSKPNSPARTPSRSVKKRKGVSLQYLKPEEKVATLTASKEVLTSSSLNAGTIIPADKKMSQRIGMRLKNLLKLPKAHKWIIFEWFYSYIDIPIFDGENEFQSYVKETFPPMRTTNLTRKEWANVRKVLGKPRRCSAAFFEEERRDLEKKRKKIRLLQKRQANNIICIKGLPEKIPMVLPIGTKVTARLRTRDDGIFGGTIDGFDSVTSTYRVTFDRCGMGTHSIPDYEIFSNDFHEMIPLTSVKQEFRPKAMSNMSPPVKCRSILNKSDPLLGQDVFDSPFKNPVSERETIGGFPIKLLEMLVRLKKTMEIKNVKLHRLREMNTEAEKKYSHDADFNGYGEDFQRRYASVVVTMERMNCDLHDFISQVQSFAPELTRDPQIQSMLLPSYLREKCREAAEDTFVRNNGHVIEDVEIVKLIKQVTSVLQVATNLSYDTNSQVVKTLEGCLEEIKASLIDNENIEVFQKNVQIHFHHIRLSIGQLALAGFDGNRNSLNNITSGMDVI